LTTITDTQDDDAGQDDDFTAGFDSADSEPTERPEAVEAQEDAPAPVAPRYAQITEDQYQQLLTKAAAVDEIKATAEKQFGTAFGKLGGIERTLRELQSQPGGVEITDDDLAELEFPEIAKEIAQVLGKKIRGGTAAAIDPAQIEVVARQVVQSERVSLHREILDGVAPGWQEVIGLPLADGTLPDTDYRKWLATQPEPYRAKINASNNAFEIAGSVKSFESARQQAAAKAKADASRNKRIESAIQPRSAGGHSLGATDDDDFLAGFNSR